MIVVEEQEHDIILFGVCRAIISNKYLKLALNYTHPESPNFTCWVYI